MGALHHSTLTTLKLIHRGKVRDIYEVDDDHLLIVATDRLSAFDVVLPQPIPGKGAVLTRVANFWFERTRGIVPNHLSDLAVPDVVGDAAERAAPPPARERDGRAAGLVPHDAADAHGVARVGALVAAALHCVHGNQRGGGGRGGP